MKSFDRKIREVRNKRLLLAIIVLIIAFIIFVLGIVEIVPKNIDYEEFNKNEKISNYAKSKIYYLIGPVLEVKDQKDKSNILGYYIASGEEGLFIIRLNENNIEIPILGKDIEKDATDTLEGIEVYGSVELSSYSLRDTLYERLNNLLNDNIVNDESFDKVFGGYYLDAVPDVKNNGIKLFILSGFFAIIGILYILINKHIRSNVNECLKELKEKGELEKVIEEFDNSKLIEYRSLQVYLSPSYIFSYGLGVDVISFNDIQEVTVSKNDINNRDKNKYIVITTKDNRQYYIAPIRRKKQKGRKLKKCKKHMKV